MPIKNFYNVGAVGVITDVPNFELPANAWSDANNVRFVGNHIESMKGFDETYNQSLFNNGNGDRYANCLSVRNVYSGLGDFKQDLIIATEKDIYSVDGTGTVSILSKGTDGYNATRTDRWTIDSLSNAVVMANIHDVPQGINATGTGSDKFRDLPNWGKTFVGEDNEINEYWRTPVLRPYKNFLLALSTIEGPDVNHTTEFKQRVRWSDITPVNQVPNNWDAGDTRRSAGYNDLTDSIGQILDGKPLKDNFIIYTSDDSFIMQYVGGSQLFAFRKLFSSEGIISSGAVTEFEGQHFVVSKDDIYIHNGQTYTSIAKNRIKDKFFKEVTSGGEPENIVVKADNDNKEIWVLYRSVPARTNYHSHGYYYGDEHGSYNKAAIWNWKYNTWTFRDLPNVTCAEFLPIIKSNLTRWSDLKAPTDTWDSTEHKQDTWSSFNLIEGSWTMQVGISLGGIWRADIGNELPYRVKDSNGVLYKKDIVSYMERASVDFRVDELPMDSFKKLKYLYPQFTGKSDVTISVGESDKPSITARYSQRFKFNTYEDYKADFRTNSRYLSLRFESIAQDDWHLADYSIDFEVGGLK